MTRALEFYNYAIEVFGEVATDPRERVLRFIEEAIELAQRRGVPPWISLEREQFRGTLKALPVRSDLTMPISEKLIVEHYSR